MTQDLRTVLIIGATSDIGRATALAYAAAGWACQLAARDEVALAREAADLTARTGKPAMASRLDILDTASFSGFVDQLPTMPDTVVCVVGLLGDQAKAEQDLEHAAMVMRSNFEGPALLLGLFAARFAVRGTGTIVGISSVAGDRGRASNYIYGSSKAGFTAFLSGLRNRLAKKGVHVVTVKPGFVHTKMTEGLKLPGAITAEPSEVGAAILKADGKRRNVIYVRPVWWLIMNIIRHIPEFIFKKLSL
jgi:short-subunit dehydrogenase